MNAGGGWYQAESITNDSFTATVSAGCNSDFEGEGFSLPDCPMLRLPLGDSSISARIACRSSVAEITGNSMTSKHPSANRQWNVLAFRLSGAVRE